MRFVPSFANGARLKVRDAELERPSTSTPFPAPVLLATDGSAGADGAVALAARLVRARRARLHVLTVVEPVAAGVVVGIIAAAADETTDEEPLHQQLRAVREQLVRRAGLPETTGIVSAAGVAAPVIADEATRRHASLVILGLRPHSLLDRVFRDETTLRVMRRADLPVLGVTSTTTDLPKRAVVGVDFSKSSLHAARAALPLLGDDATLYLAHVEPPRRDWDGGGGEDPLLSAAIPAGFARFRDLLRAPAHVRIEQVILDGESFDELDVFAGRVGADLVALGSIRTDQPVPRGGRLREAFVRAAGVSVLVGPPAARAGIMED